MHSILVYWCYATLGFSIIQPKKKYVFIKEEWFIAGEEPFQWRMNKVNGQIF